MICQSVSAPGLPETVAQRLDQAFAYLRDTDFSAMADGIYPIAGEDIYAMVESFHVSTPIDAEFECHERYIDVQFVIRGELHLMIASRSELTGAGAYDPAKDVVFFERTSEYSTLILRAGEAAVLFPNDAHRMVCMPDGQPVDIQKCVVKVKV